jgi:hypothetical protein
MPRIDGYTLFTVWTAHSITEEMMLHTLAELFSALQEAWEKMEFTHYDLHLGNVILEKAEPYHWEWRNYRDAFSKDFRPVLIDFGRSRAVLDGEVVSRVWDPIQGDYLCIDRDRSYPAHDIFKILVSCVDIRETPRLVQAIHKLFNVYEDKVDLDMSYAAASFSLPYREEYGSIQYKDAVDCMVSLFGTTSS